ncbi:hypothetical protein D7Y13_19845 [Corallococcus praedator]|uniref:Lipoprotein n=1 Tax=Corallococcus praedator TaxID=2316724 RepID=A0ABX9QG67_9BACT|nr:MULTISPECIES: hypothetical protein [Corallococcus]RKH29072.1 hypothetical protein D7X75_23575 [Corallococcus sp. CA031C]RKI06627.1 hypothetical protein D7Y13_19845 [Corallococcus praedator]
MRKAHAVALSMAALMLGQTGCYRTHITTNLRPEEGRHHEDKQWFTAAGLVPLSKPPGSECQNGVAWAQSRVTPSDFFIQAGLVVLGGLIGGAVCSGSNQTEEEQNSCAGVGALVPLALVGSRTVAYACAAADPSGLPTPGMPLQAPGRTPDDSDVPVQVPSTPTPPPLPPSGSVPETTPGL